jgi:hypothetical protein
MHDSDPNAKKGDPRQPDHLLDELTSIKALLDGEPRSATDVPMLDDVVGFAASFKAVDAEPAPALLDLERIFGDGAGEADPAAVSGLAFPKFTLDVALSDAPTAVDYVAPDQHANYRRAALISELVAEFLPQIEAALRERLQDLDEDVLRTLKKPY